MLTESWMEGKSVEEKDTQPTERIRSLMRIVKQNRFKNLGELHKEWTEAGVKASHTDVSRNLDTVVVRGVLPGLRRRRTGLLPSSSKSSFQMRASFVFHLETKVLESGGRVEKLIAQVAWSPVLSFHSLWLFGMQCHLLVLVHCVFWKPTSLLSFTKKFWSTSYFLLRTFLLLFKDADIVFQQDLAPAHTAKSTKSWLNYVVLCAWLASKLTRPEPHRESIGYYQEENEKQETKICRLAEGHCQWNLGFHTSSAFTWFTFHYWLYPV